MVNTNTYILPGGGLSIKYVAHLKIGVMDVIRRVWCLMIAQSLVVAIIDSFVARLVVCDDNTQKTTAYTRR